MGIRQPVLLHKRLNRRRRPPLAGVHLIAADVQIGIGEDRRQLADDRVDKLIHLVSGRIERRLMHTPLALHAIRPRRAHQVGIGHRDAGGVPRHVDLRHHANAARRGVSHHLPHLLTGVKQAVAGLLLQFGVMLGGKAPALIVGQVPVEYVELGRRHAVELAQNVRQRQEMARRIQQHATPREARHVADIHQRQEGVLPVGLQQLQQSFHAAQRAEAGVGGQRGALRRDRQPVTRRCPAAAAPPPGL